MKKVVLGLLAGCLLIESAFAQSPMKRATFSIHAGYQILTWSDVVSQHITLEGRAGIRLAKSFELSPEIMFSSEGHGGYLPADRTCFYPGFIANYVTRRFFAGAGLVIPLQEYRPAELSPKVNLGLVFGRFMLTAHLIISKLERGSGPSPAFGLSAGYRF